MAHPAHGRDDARPPCTFPILRFTPGPWRWDGYSLRPANPNPDAHAVHTILEAEHLAWGFAGSDLAACLAEDVANRHLIAAAPDLYEALADLLDQVQHAPGGNLFLTGLAGKALQLAQGGRQ